MEELLAQFASCDILLIEGAVSADIPCLELIKSTALVDESKFPPQQLSAYISMSSDTVDTGRSRLPILPGTDPEFILQFLEELWNAKSL